MASNAELQAEVDRLTADNQAWAEDNDRLRAELAEAEKRATPAPNTKPQPVEPSFGLTEGNRDELERVGRTVSPFTGARLVGTPDAYHEVSQDEFTKHAKENPAA